MNNLTCFECEKAQLEKIEVDELVPLSEERSITVRVEIFRCPACKAECMDNAASLKIEAAITEKYPNYFKQNRLYSK